MQFTDTPKSLKSSDACEERSRMLGMPHMLPLRDFVESLRQEMGSAYGIPHFDPLDGGINARVLFLLEAPGAKAVSSGFVSRNNPDETARNFFELNIAAGIARTDTVCWNVVPWYIGTGTKIRPARHDDIRQALGSLRRLLTLLPNVRIVALVGNKSASLASEVVGMFPDSRVIATPHPSPLFINRRPENRGILLDAFKEISAALQAYGPEACELANNQPQQVRKHIEPPKENRTVMKNHNISEGVRKSWEDPVVRERRRQRHGVSVLRNGTPVGEYSSLYQAFKALGLPENKHIPFRNKLKLAGALTYNDGVDIYAFSLIPPFTKP